MTRTGPPRTSVSDLPAPPARDAETRARVAKRTEEVFREADAFREGHFALKSGRHADRYLEKFQVLQHPPAVTELCGFIVERVRAHDGSALVDVVAGPTTGGIILAFEAARQLGVRGIFAEEVRDRDATRREFRRGFMIEPGERVLLVDDILTTGGSLLAMLPAVEARGGEVVLGAVLVDRSGGLHELVSGTSGRRYPAEALWSLDLPTYEPGPSSCPACAAGLPVHVPGSSGTQGDARGDSAAR